MAQSDIFLQIDGIEGESRDAVKTNQIEIESFGFGGTNSGPPSQTAKPKVTLAPIELVKVIDKSSPNLFGQLTVAKTFNATITVRKSGNNPVDYVKIELGNCIVSGYNLTVGKDGMPMERILLSYGSIKYSYWTQDEKGSPGPVNQKSYNVQTNTPS